MVLRFFMLAVVFFLACADVERANPYDERSSTFIVPQIVYGTPVSYEGETYQTVVIGSQTWMARNLNYNANGSRCYDCPEYGRLYDWATAMALPDNCNTSSCASQISNENHRGICPIGWHIPSDGEWDKLLRYVGGAETAGRYLKAKNGWTNWRTWTVGDVTYNMNEPSGPNGGGGTDTYGFSALPGGYGSSDGNFGHIGDNGYWWSTNESNVINANIMSMGCSYEDAYLGILSTFYKYHLLSVRCVQD